MIIPIVGMDVAVADVDDRQNTNDDEELITKSSAQWNEKIPESVTAYRNINLDASNIREQIQNNKEISIDFNGQTYVLKLIDFQMFSDDAKAYLRDTHGELSEIPREDLKAYSGYVVGEKGSTVYALTSPELFSAVITTDVKMVMVEPLTTYDRNANPQQHIVHEISRHSQDRTTKISFDALPLQIPNAYASLNYANIIMDCDEEFYDLYPSNWQYHQGQALLTSYNIYDNANISFYISQNVCDSSGTEYTESDIDDRLAQLQNYWDGESDTRDFVVLTSGKDFDLGQIGVTPHEDYPIADTANDAYIVAQMVEDSYGYSDGSLAHRQIIIGHEIGHMFGAVDTEAEVVNPSNPPTYTIMKHGVDIDQLAALLSDDNESTVESAGNTYL